MFNLGICMVLYDTLGHFCCLLARLGITTYFWNHYAKFIWPSIKSAMVYDAFWSMWFFMAVGLIILGNENNRGSK